MSDCDECAALRARMSDMLTRLHGEVHAAAAQLAELPMSTAPVASSALVATFEREGLRDALKAVAAVLDGHGLQKHGVQKWRRRSPEYIRAAADRHQSETGKDPESGYPHRAHEVVRLLMLLQLEMEGE